MTMTSRPRTRFEWLRPFTTHVVNRFARPLVPWVPGFAIIRYHGRRTGTLYRTPMTVFRDGDDYVFVLPYGSHVDWVRNVMAAGEVELVIRRASTRLAHPVLFVDPTRHFVPAVVRVLLRVGRVTEFLRMSPAAPAA